jgi:hypothetical protein
MILVQYQLQYFTSIKSYPNKPIQSPLAKKTFYNNIFKDLNKAQNKI